MKIGGACHREISESHFIVFSPETYFFLDECYDYCVVLSDIWSFDSVCRDQNLCIVKLHCNIINITF